MGEYIKNVKIGTCEDLYYTTYEQLKNYQNMDIDTMSEKKPYLRLNSGSRFRFPFPDENIKIGNHDDFDRGVLIKVPTCDRISTAHREFFININENSLRIGAYIKCPKDVDLNYSKKEWSTEGYTFIEIVQQKYTDVLGKPQLVAVGRCPYCSQKFLLSEEEIDYCLEVYNSLPVEKYELQLELKVIELAKEGYSY